MGANVRFFSATFFGFRRMSLAAIDCIKVTQRHDLEVTSQSADQALLRKKQFGPPGSAHSVCTGCVRWITVAEPIWWRAGVANAAMSAACTIHFTGCPLVAARRHDPRQVIS